MPIGFCQKLYSFVSKNLRRFSHFSQVQNNFFSFLLLIHCLADKGHIYVKSFCITYIPNRLTFFSSPHHKCNWPGHILELSKREGTSPLLSSFLPNLSQDLKKDLSFYATKKVVHQFSLVYELRAKGQSGTGGSLAATASVNFSGKIPLVTTTIHYGNTPCFSLALLELTKKNLETKKISRDYLYSDSYFMYNSPYTTVYYYIHRYLK